MCTFTFLYGPASPAPPVTCERHPDPRNVAAGHCHVVVCKKDDVRHVRSAMDDLDSSKRAVDLMVIEDALKTTARLKHPFCMKF